MTVDECIRAYKKVAQKAFTPKRSLMSFLPARPNGAFSATDLEDAIRDVIKEFCVEPGCISRRKESKSTSTTCPHSEMEFHDPTCTKT